MKSPMKSSSALLLTVCGTALFFIVSMYKVLVPQAIFGELQAIYGDEEVVSWLGAAYMYSYAASQLTTGPLTDRFGGIRIMLSGALMFIVGIGIFPFCTNFPLAIALRLISGFGAGMSFTGLARLLAELYPGSYTKALSIAIGFSFFGPALGTLPTRWLIGTTGWKFTMCVPAVIAAFSAIPAAVQFLRSPIPRPHFTTPENRPSAKSVLNCDFILLALASSPLFGVYYIILTQLGARPIEELCRISPDSASACIMAMTILVACVTLTEGVSPDPDLLARAQAQGITLLGSSRSTYDTAVALAEALK